MWPDSVLVELLLVGAAGFVVAPLLGVGIARIRGPLTWTRGLIGAVMIPIAWSVLDQLTTRAARLALDAQQLSVARYCALAFTVGWIVEAALIGALATALWRAFESSPRASLNPSKPYFCVPSHGSFSLVLRKPASIVDPFNKGRSVRVGTVAALLGGLMLGGCGSSTAPRLAVPGTWNYQAQAQVSTGGTCAVAATMTFTQTEPATGDTVFTGTYTNATITCEISGVQTVLGPYTGIIQGAVDAQGHVGFQCDYDSYTSGPQSWETAGTISGESMAGGPYGPGMGMNLQIVAGGQDLILAGTWSAKRQ